MTPAHAFIILGHSKMLSCWENEMTGGLLAQRKSEQALSAEPLAYGMRYKNHVTFRMGNR